MNNIENLDLEIFLMNDVDKKLTINNTNNPLRLLLLKKMVELNKKVLYIVPNEQIAYKTQNDLLAFDEKSEVFPYQQTPMYEDITPDLYTYQEQLDILRFKPDVVIAPVKSLLEKFPTPEFFEKNTIKLERNKDVKYDKIIQELINFGYKRTNIALDVGEFCVRGDILDIYIAGKNPVRIEFFGDTIEDIRFFDPKTQKSFEKIEKIEIVPLRKFILEEKNIQDFKKKKFENKNLMKETVEKLETTGYFEGIEYYQNYFNPELKSVFEHLNDYIIVYDDLSQIDGKFRMIDSEYQKYFEQSKISEMKLPLESQNHLSFIEYCRDLQNAKYVNFDNFVSESPETIRFNTSSAPIFSANIDKIVYYIREKLKNGYNICICTDFGTRMKEVLKENEIFTPNVEILSSLALGGGIVENIETIFLSDKELFNKHSKDITSKKHALNRSSRDYIETVNDISTGEYVVHKIHGIGIYKGLCKQEIDGCLQDYLEIHFAKNDKLFMPAEQVNLLFRYRGTGNKAPKLSIMGGSAWETTKEKAKESLQDITRDLLLLQAQRESEQGIAFDLDTNWQFEMEEAFEYTETPDQMQAILDTKADMESPKPMDRLICADVGFGKTEIAIRAIFKAVMSSYQVALIVPSNVLAYQHYLLIKERFKPFSVNVELLSSFRTKSQTDYAIKCLKMGKVDVIIGTQRLLHDKVQFKKLGLLIIDEEHCFGVLQKEQLKTIQKNIDVLTLSATPIPRTLNMALSGLKDITIINTPPKNRLPVKTYVGVYNENYIKTAINNEIQRDGQVFYVFNNVQHILPIKEKIKKLVPTAKIAVAHGQMKDGELQDIMIDFSRRKYDILLCTTIIESGLDLPYANTIIVENADMLGLAQLYQLRGRVGRSDRQAYCYCFYEANKVLNEASEKRLEAIREFTTLGSGYNIALKDSEIRGVGNILGAKQHGHIVDVGFDTYCNLLEECINELKTKKATKKEITTTININATAFIPDAWVGSVEQKIAEYKKLSDVKTVNDLEDAVISLKDRFSKLPESVDNLVKIIKLRLLAQQCNIASINDTGENIRIYTPFTEKEWQIIVNRDSKNVTKYFEYKKPPKHVLNAKGILVYDKSDKDLNETFNILGDLLYHISSIIIEFNKEN